MSKPTKKNKKKPAGDYCFELEVLPEQILLTFNAITVTKHEADKNGFYRANYVRKAIVGSGTTVVDSLRTVEMYLHGELLSLRCKINELENNK